MNTGIYIIKNTVNNKVYIGQTFKVGFHDRLRAHKYKLRTNTHPNKHLQSSWNKYGEEKFEFSIIENIEDENIIDEREKYWISYYDSMNPKKGYNKQDGGCLNRNRSEDSREKMRNMYKGRKLSLEHRKNISLATSGELHHAYGKHFSEEHKKKLSDSHKGKTLSEEQKKKISEANKNRKVGLSRSTTVLTVELVTLIKKDLANDISIKDICEKHKVNRDSVTNIKRLASWKYICPELNDTISKLKKGYKNNWANPIKFNAEKISNIRDKYEQGASIKSIAKEYDASRITISNVVNRKGVYQDI